MAQEVACTEENAQPPPQAMVEEVECPQEDAPPALQEMGEKVAWAEEDVEQHRNELEARRQVAQAQGDASQEDDGAPQKMAPPHEVGTPKTNEVYQEVEHHGKSAPQEDAASPQKIQASNQIGPHVEIAIS
jgi:hypothetical protein